MNKQRIQEAIALMQTLSDEQFYMPSWQKEYTKQHIVTTLEEAHACGTPCCLGGWISLTPNFQEAGGHIGRIGNPMLHDHTGSKAIARYFDIDWNTAATLTCCGLESYNKLLYNEIMGNKPKTELFELDIRPRHVVAALELILAGWTLERAQEQAKL